MKKIGPILIALVLILFPLLTNAISPDQVTPENIAGGGVVKDVSAPIQNVSGIVGIAANVVKWIYVIFFITAVIYILFAAFAYLTESDDSEKIKVVHTRIKYAAIAITVALLAVGFELIIRNFLTTDGNNSSSGTNTGDYWRVNQGGNLPYDTTQFRVTPFNGNQPLPLPTDKIL